MQGKYMNLEDRITKTLTLFALQSTALTLLELWHFLVRDAVEFESSVSAHGELIEVPVLENRTTSIAEIFKVLALLVVSGEVVEKYGYYTTRAHEDLLQKRWHGYSYGVWREKRIRRFSKALAYIPFVRGVGLAGSQALGLERVESDIDLFIITAPGWLWLPRTLITGFFQVLGIRRHGRFVANRVCLNHYVSDAKQMTHGRNWYTAIEYAKLRPVHGAPIVAQFQNANCDWVTVFFPNVDAPLKKQGPVSRIQKVLEVLFATIGGAFLERMFGQWQSSRIHKNEPHIIVSEDELSFHPQSKQDALLEAFK